MMGGYWRIDHSFNPTLVITNFLENVELPVTPILYGADGTEYQLPLTTLSAAGVTSIDIRAALNAAPSEIQAHFSDYGSAAVKYAWHWQGAATAMVQNRDAKRSLNFNFQLRTPAPMQHGTSTTVQEGLWWKEDSGVKGFLALMNVTSRPISVRVQVVSEYGAFESEKGFHLQPNETRSIDLLTGAEGSSGGIRVSYEGAAKDIVLAGGLENPLEGYSAQIPFLTISPDAKTSVISVSSVGLMLGAPDPMMKFPSGTQFGIYLALRNTTEQPISIIPTLYYMEGAEVRKVALKTLTLAARQARHWSPKELSEELGLPALNATMNLVFSYQGGPSDVIIANGSIDQTKNYVFEIDLKTVGKTEAMALKGWDISNGNDTMISLLNLGESDQDLSIIFFFDGGRYTLPMHLKAGGSAMLNVSDIITMQQPDANGNKFPLSVTHGSAVLSGALGYPEWINVGVSVGIFNVSTATCGNTCPTCFGYYDFQVQANNSTAAVGGTATFKALALGQDNFWHDVTAGYPANGVFVSWSSTNSGVATSQGAGSFTGVSPGTFNASAMANLIDATSKDCPGGSHATCPNLDFGPASAPGTVQKPGYLQVVSSSNDTTVCLSMGCATYIRYRVLDTVRNPMNIPGMTIAESYSVNNSTTCSGNFQDSGVWTTDSTGTLTQPDEIYWCCSGQANYNCRLSLNQYFTVNGQPVLIRSADGNTNGIKNTITVNCTNGQASCPGILIN
jgi:hypothetical protein